MERSEDKAESIPSDLRQPEAVAYRRAARRRGRLGLVVDTLVLAGWALAAAGLDDLLGGPAPLRAALLAAVVGATLEAARLPLGVAGLRASRRAGLSRQDRRSWLADRAKGWLLAAVLGLPVAAAVVWLQRALSDAWPAAAWAGSLVLSLLLALAFPVLLLPLFLPSEALPPGPLRTVVDDVVARSGLAVRDVRLLRLGRKTSGSNAAVVGIGPTRRILVGDTLAGLDGAPADDEPGRERLDETAAVLAHELAHHRHGDVWRGLAVEATTSLAVLWAAAALLAVAPASLAHGGAGDPASLPALALALGLASAPAGLVGAWHSRRRERAADRYAVALAGGEPFARALERLVASNLSELEPPRLTQLRASHPAPAERIAAARAALVRTA